MTVTTDGFEEALDVARSLVLADTAPTAYVSPVSIAGGYHVSTDAPLVGGYVAITRAPAPMVGTIRRGGLDIWTV